MPLPEPKTVVISLGGSLIVPDEIDVGFLKEFVAFIKGRIAKGERFVLITGGGKVCRRYQQAAKELCGPSQEDLDMIGIASTRLNAELSRAVFGDVAEERVVTEEAMLDNISKPVVISAGWAPGSSTDLDAVIVAEKMGAARVVNLSNIDYAYDKDPKRYPDAKKIEKILWRDFRKIIPEKWEPGLNSPFDPTAARRAEKLGLEAAIMNGRNLENLANYLDGKSFKGTVISGR